jgi:hypothetical protein
LFRSRASLETEILALRHQLNILRRKSPRRPMLGSIGHSSDGPSWIDLAEIRLSNTESPFAAYLNRLCNKICHKQTHEPQLPLDIATVNSTRLREPRVWGEVKGEAMAIRSFRAVCLTQGWSDRS